MKQLTKSDKEKLFAKLFWDLNVDSGYIARLLEGEIDSIGTIRKSDVYYRLLTTYDWYKILKIVPHDNLAEMLDDTVIRKIKPQSLAKKYTYARKLLHK